MKTRILFGAAAALGALALAGAASAASIVNIVAVSGENLYMPLITDFDSIGGTGADSKGGTITDLAPGYTFTQGSADSYTRLGSAGATSLTAPPPNDTGYYETVEGGSTATLTSTTGLMEFQFYMGSPDTFNSMVFTFTDFAGDTQTLTGTQIWGGSPPGNGDQSKGFTVSYTFSAPVNEITFQSSQNSFEFDKLAGGIPEPASWALMIMGFGGAGAALRSRRRAVAATA